MNIFKRLTAGCLALAMLAGCTPATPSPSPTVGGYAETEITPPDSKDWTWKTICADEDGRVHIFGVDADSTAEAVLPQTVHHEVYENGEWQTVPADWAGQLAELCPAPGTDGLYSITFGVEEDCVWTAVSFTASVNMVQDEKNDPDGNRLWLFCEKDGVLEGGEVILHDVPPGNLYFSGAVQCRENLLLSTGCSVLEVDRDGNLLNSYAGRNGALQEDGTVVWEDENTLVRYPRGTNTVETPDWEQVTAPNLQMTSRDGIAYLLGKSGFFRAKDTTMEQLGESRWLRVGNANFMPLGLAVVRDDLFYLMESIGRVYRYEYDPEYTVVEEEIKVVSILPNKAVETAITELAREHREITVDYQYLFEDTSFDTHLVLRPFNNSEDSYSNYEDVVRSLYASIAAGDGPDVLLLDDLDASVLIQQGMLSDLNEFLDTSVVYPALSEAFAQDGKQYGLPTWFYPWIVSSWGDMPKMDTFDDLKNVILSGTEHVSLYSIEMDERKPDKPEGVNISMIHYGELFSMMYIAWKQQLLTGERAVIEAFLQQGKQLGEHMDLWPNAAFTARWNSSWSHHFKSMDANMACAGMIFPPRYIEWIFMQRGRSSLCTRTCCSFAGHAREHRMPAEHSGRYTHRKPT